MSSITIIGPGAIGGTVAAWLAQDKANRISICARTPFDRLELDAPEGQLLATPQLFTSPEEAKEAGWVLIATKAYDVDATVQWLPKLVGASTRVAILQNGVEHIERFAPFLATDLLVPVVVDLSAERKAPGHIWQRSKGSLIVPDNDNGRDFVQLFASTPLTATVTTDFRTHAWRKLTLNCTGVVPALLLRSVDVGRTAHRNRCPQWRCGAYRSKTSHRHTDEPADGSLAKSGRPAVNRLVFAWRFSCIENGQRCIENEQTLRQD